MPDVQLLDLRDGGDAADVPVVESVSGQDDQPHLPRRLGRGSHLFQLAAPVPAALPSLGVLAGVDLDLRRAQFLALADLIEIRVGKDRDVHARVGELAHHLLHIARVQDDVQSPLGGQLVATLRNERHLMRLDRLRGADHLRRRGHLDVEMRRHSPAQDLHVAVLNVSPVAAEMDGDALRAGELADHRRGDGIGLVALPRLADRGDVVDVDG